MSCGSVDDRPVATGHRLCYETMTVNRLAVDRPRPLPCRPTITAFAPSPDWDWGPDHRAPRRLWTAALATATNLTAWRYREPAG